MTRDEAIEIVGGLFQSEQTSAHTWQASYGRPECIIDAFVALGMLKLDEPKCEPKFSILEAIKICRSAYMENDAFITGLEKHGFKIVEK